MEEKKVHLAAKASFEAWAPLSGVVFREESEFEVKMAPNHQKTSIFENLRFFGGFRPFGPQIHIPREKLRRIEVSRPEKTPWRRDAPIFLPSTEWLEPISQPSEEWHPERNCIVT